MNVPRSDIQHEGIGMVIYPRFFRDATRLRRDIIFTCTHTDSRRLGMSYLVTKCTTTKRPSQSHAGAIPELT